jgi:hypothetical protein
MNNVRQRCCGAVVDLLHHGLLVGTGEHNPGCAAWVEYPRQAAPTILRMATAVGTPYYGNFSVGIFFYDVHIQ